MMGVEIVVFDGVDELDFLAPYEVLSRAAPGKVQLVALKGPRRVRGKYGLEFDCDGPLAARPDVLIVPGGGWAGRESVGAWGEAQRGELPDALAAAAAHARLLASVCTGALVLAGSGVIDGRRAATHPSARSDLAGHGVTVLEDRVVDDGDYVSCGGVTSGIDLALHLVEREYGAARADAIATSIDYERYRVRP